MNRERKISVSKLNHIKYYEASNFNPKKIAMFASTVALIILYSFLKGNSSMKSIIGLSTCHWGQFLMLGILILIMIVIQIISIKIVINEQNTKIEHNYMSPHEMKFTKGKIILMILFGPMVGFLANILGLGGGFVIFPFFVLLGVSPLVSSACTMYLILLSKIVAAILAFSSGYLLYDYSALQNIGVMISVICFVFLTDFIIRK